LDASTASDFTGTRFSTTTPSGSLTTLTVSSATNLAANTTYYLRLGNVVSGTTAYINTSPSSTSTLTNLVSGGQIYGVYQSSLTANWAGLGSGNAEGYRLKVSTASDFTGTTITSATTDVTLTTLTVSGLADGTTYYVRVGGLNWNSVSNPVVLGSTKTTALGNVVQTGTLVDSTGINSQRSLARGSDGKLHAVYYRGSAPSNIYYAYSTDGGATWTEEAVTAKTGTNHQVYPKLAVDSANNVHVIWTGLGWGTNSGKYNIQYSSRTGGAWGTPESVTDNSHNTPGVAVSATEGQMTLGLSSNDNVNVAWGDDNLSNSIYYRKRTTSWQTAELVYNTNTPYFPSMAIDSQDNVHLVWEEDSGGGASGITYDLRTSGGWQGTEVVASIANNQVKPSIAVDSADNIHVVWSGTGWGSHSGNYNVEYRKRASGVWQTQEAVTDIASDQTNGLSISGSGQAIAVDASDNVQVVWTGLGWGTNTANQNLQFRQRTSSWQTQVGITDFSEDQQYPSQIWARWPSVSSALTNRPKTGYAFVWSALSGGVYKVKYSSSTNLTWDTAGAGPITTTGSGYWYSTTPDAPWPSGVVPKATDTAIIANGHTVTSTGTVTISSISINSGGELDFDGSAIAAPFTVGNGGQFTNNGTAKITSSAHTVTIQGASGGSMTFTGNDITHNAKTVYLSNVNYQPTMTLASGDGVALSGACTFYALTANSGSTVNQGTNNNLVINGNTTLATGTFTKDAGTGTLQFKGAITVNSGNQDLGNVSF
jgi:hypothetical protein